MNRKAVKTSKNTLKSPGDLKRLAVTHTSVKNHLLNHKRKTHNRKKNYDNKSSDSDNSKNKIARTEYFSSIFYILRLRNNVSRLISAFLLILLLYQSIIQENEYILFCFNLHSRYFFGKKGVFIFQILPSHLYNAPAFPIKLRKHFSNILLYS